MSRIQDAQRILQSGDLQPGKHRKLLIAIVKLFSQRFAPDCTVLYIGDVGNKSVIYEKDMLEELGVPLTIHSKLPDTILYDETKDLLFLLEAVTSHGPIKTKRLFELEKVLKNCSSKRVYISAFYEFTQYEEYAFPIAWETHVWIAEVPEHMIHYDGDKYMSQHE